MRLKRRLPRQQRKGSQRDDVGGERVGMVGEVVAGAGVEGDIREVVGHVVDHDVRSRAGGEGAILWEWVHGHLRVRF